MSSKKHGANAMANDNASEYTKTSIHNHFGGRLADCTIDKPISFKPEFDLTKGFREIDEAFEQGFTLLAQTNSNCIDAASWMLMRRYALSKGIELLPGVEISLTNWNDHAKTLHVVVIFPPTSEILRIQFWLLETYKSNGSFQLGIQQLCDLLSQNRAILYIHGLKQTPHSIGENPEMARELISLNKFFPVAFEDNRDFHKLVLVEKIKSFLKHSQVEWLDEKAADLSAADRTSFSRINSPTFIWAGNSFEDLFYSVLTGSRRIVREEDIVRRVSYVSRIVIDEGLGMQPSSIECSQGLNCIVGSSGSGKTLLLDIIKLKLRGEHLSSSVSSSGDYEGVYNISQIHLFGPDGREIDQADEFEVIEGEDLYQKVIRAYLGSGDVLMKELGLEIDRQGFSALVDRFERDANTYLHRQSEINRHRRNASTYLAQAQSAAKFIEANDVSRADTIQYNTNPAIAAEFKAARDAIAQCDMDLAETRDSFKRLEDMARRNHFPEDLISRLSKLRSDYLAQLMMNKDALELTALTRQLQRDSQSLLFQACQLYNGVVSGQFQQTNEKKQVLSDKLDDLSRTLLAAAKLQFRAEIPCLNEDEVRTSITLVSDNDVAKLTVNRINLTINAEEDLQKVFPDHIRRRASPGKLKSSLVELPLDLSNECHVKRLLDLFASEGIEGDLRVVIPLDFIADCSIELRDDDGCYRHLEEFSAGMLSKVYVTHFLDSAISNAGSSTMVLYDQPESNMEKEFLIETLARKLATLRSAHQIFVATHEPLLVVNADANEIILASNDKKVDQPNLIKYENRSFVGTHGRPELIEAVAKLIDGGTEAVKHRSEVYEGMI